MGNNVDITKAEGWIVTKDGLVKAPLVDGKFFICPECQLAPCVAEFPNGDNVYLICETPDCANHLEPSDYKEARSM